MTRILSSTYVSLIFLAANLVILRIILALNRRTDSTPSQAKPGEQDSQRPGRLDASDILGHEFEYARATASEAMRDRHRMINFYLVFVGAVATGVAAICDKDSRLPYATGTVLLWLLCCVGWLYFLKLIRLRQAWHDSARTMNQIKEFYIQHVEGFDQEALRSAFRWQAHTLPPPDKPWTVYFYSAMLIALLNSVAYVAGGALLALDAVLPTPLPALGLLALFGLAFFAFHVWLYFAFLKPTPPAGAAHRGRR